ncbi:23S rRNA (cytidine(2498)-2'-O)-methyltransferase RlmM [Methylonatrum kenyense]|uniref:23S rRNA (cytidine(2498)-2'-O)-methyltransferase RlmM n=1 Tax=Methylonatrum kenyense TaxID=455253 RepID=UPI0020BD6CFF|nr:23S rRNA (cytidine(2498)-2'-O)-methyltransferase RlmM [Methylonatrum kenyense]MCK8516454.1 23S rRNA (cytidine(2498)-2'-O)-methyltransferase RlmM [Methylonatrum kenyense]
MANESPSLLFYCRPGFEKDCAAEIMARSSAESLPGYVRARHGDGWLQFHGADSGVVEELSDGLDLRDLVFPRQWLLASAEPIPLPRRDRVQPVLEALENAGRIGPYAALCLDHPDTNCGKQVSALTRRLRKPLEKGLASAGISSNATSAPRRLHLFFSDFDQVFPAEGLVGRSSPEANGILRLRQSRGAPSRSGLKLDEAIRLMLPSDVQDTLLRPAAMAVDLGAAPGGWSWQLVRRHIRVTAVDNGPIQPELLDSGLVEHRREDGFRYRPPSPVDLLVCDMVERPVRVSDLVAHWLAQGWCRAVIFNLKLPMKQRHQTVRDCLARLPTGPAWHTVCRHLYHDRDEVTVAVFPAGATLREATLG